MQLQFCVPGVTACRHRPLRPRHPVPSGDRPLSRSVRSGLMSMPSSSVESPSADALTGARTVRIAVERRIAAFERVIVERRIDVERMTPRAVSLPLSDESLGPVRARGRGWHCRRPGRTVRCRGSACCSCGSPCEARGRVQPAHAARLADRKRMQSACRAAPEPIARGEMAIGTTDAHPLISQIEFPYAFGCQSPSFRGTNPIRTAAAGRPTAAGLPARLRQAAPMMKDDLNPRSPPAARQSDARDLLHRFAEFRFQTVVESITDYAVFMLDPYGNVATWNAGPRASAIAPRRSSATTSRASIRPTRSRPAGSLETAEAAANGHFEDEGWRVRKDGSQFWANVTITPVHDHSNQLCGFIKITRDMTERKRLEARSVDAPAQRVHRNARARAAQPSRAVAPLGRRAAEPGQPGPRARAVPRRRASSGHATDAARRRPARRRAHHRRQARAERPADYRARHRVPRRRKHPAEAGRARQHIHVDLPADAVPLHGDDARLVQVLHNLLDNASKFSPLGGRIDVGATIEGRSSRSA